MKLKFMLATALCAVSLSSYATNYDLGTLSATGFDTKSASSVTFASTTILDDKWMFALTKDSASSFGALQTFAVDAAAISNFSGILFEGTTEVGALTFHKDDDNGLETLRWKGPLSAGSYYVEITGTAIAGTQYSGTVSALPVPEPETYGMMLGGLALIGALARRKAKKAA